MVKQLTTRLEQVWAERFVLISSIDVFPRIADADETFDCTLHENHPYGRHRLLLEQFVASRFPQSFIVRLPGLFGAGLKKNAIFDLLHHNQLEKLNPDSQFHWYDMRQLWSHLQIVIVRDLRLVMLATEPVATGDIQSRFFPSLSIGVQATSPIYYNIQTRYSELFGGNRGKAHVFTNRKTLEQVTQAIIERGERTGIEDEDDDYERFGLYFSEAIGYIIRADGSQTPLYYGEIKVVKATGEYHAIPRTSPRRTS